MPSPPTVFPSTVDENASRRSSSAVNGDSEELHEFQKIRLRHVDAAGKKLMSVDKFRDPFHSLLIPSFIS